MSRNNGYLFASGFVPIEGGCCDEADTTYSSLQSLSDVNISSAEDKEILQYSNTSNQWINRSIPVAVQSISNDTSSVAIGQDAKAFQDSVALGWGAMKNVTTAEACTAVGYNSLGNLVYGNGNTSLGEASGSALETGSNCTLLGSNANVSGAGVSNSTVVGKSCSSGNNSSVLGYSSIGYVNAIAIGNNSRATNESVVIGHSAGAALTALNGGTNVLIGDKAGLNLIGDNNTVINAVASSLTSGDGNLIAGVGSDVIDPDCQYGVALGAACTTHSGGVSAGTQARAWIDGVSIGYRAKGGVRGISIGKDSGFSVDTFAADNILMGHEAAKNLFGGQTNTVINAKALSLVSGSNNLLLGLGSDVYSSFSNNAIALGGGEAESYSVSIGDQSHTNFEGVAIGRLAGASNLTGNGSIFIGARADSATISDNVVVIGEDAKIGASGISIGNFAGSIRNQFSVAIGEYAGNGTAAVPSNSSNNIFMGFQSGALMEQGTANVLLGVQTDVSNPSGNTVDALAVGWNAKANSRAISLGSDSSAPHSWSTAIGYQMDTLKEYHTAMRSKYFSLSESGVANMNGYWVANGFTTTSITNIQERTMFFIQATTPVVGNAYASCFLNIVCVGGFSTGINDTRGLMTQKILLTYSKSGTLTAGYSVVESFHGSSDIGVGILVDPVVGGADNRVRYRVYIDRTTGLAANYNCNYSCHMTPNAYNSTVKWEIDDIGI